MVDFEKVRYPRLHRHNTDRQTDRRTHKRIQLAIEVRLDWQLGLGWQVGARLTDNHNHNFNGF